MSLKFSSPAGDPKREDEKFCLSYTTKQNNTQILRDWGKKIMAMRRGPNRVCRGTFPGTMSLKGQLRSEGRGGASKTKRVDTDWARAMQGAIL